MKKRIFTLMLALCLVLSMMPVPAFAEGEVTEPITETAAPEETKKSEEPVVHEETKKSEEPVIPEEGKKTEEPATPEEGKKTEEPATPEEGKKSEAPVIPEEGKKTEDPVIPEEGKKTEDPVIPEETKKPEEPTAAQRVQTLIDALPETVTAENRAEVEAQLTAIDEAKDSLGDEERAALDFGKYNAAVAAINVLDNQPGAEVPKTMEVQSLEGATVSVTKTCRYNGAPQTLEAADVTVTLEGTPLAAGTDYTVTAASQTYPGTYSFSVTGKGNYTGEVTGNWKIEKGQLDDKYKTIRLKLKPGGDSITFDAADMLPDMGEWCNIIPNQGRHVSLRANGTLITISCQKDAGDDVMAQLVIHSTYYEKSYLTLQIERVDSLDGNSCPLTVTMADWNVGDKPNKPTITGLPETRYNYRVAYAKKDGTQLSGVPSDGGQYTVTASCMDAENNIYSGSAEFSVWMEVTFNPNGGTLPADTATTVRINTETLDPLPVPTWTGHTFLGWFTDKTEGHQVDKDTIYTGNTTLYARWKTNTYTISFDANGGKGEMDPLAMTYGKTENLTANDFTRDGYRFTGWNTQADGKGNAYFEEEPVSNLSTADNDKITLYAQWIKVINRVNLSISGHGLDKSVGQVTVTTADDISFTGSYPTGWGITKSPSDLTALDGQLFQAETQYYLWVKFSAKEGCVLEGLNEKNVFLDGRAAQAVENAQGTVTAVFRLPVIYTITVTTGLNGSVDVDNVVPVFEGEDVTINITPDKGYVVYRLTVDGKNVKTTRTYTFENVQENHTFKVRFLKNGDNAKTGDSFPMGIALGAVTLSFAALAALFFLRKRKQMR